MEPLDVATVLLALIGCIIGNLGYNLYIGVKPRHKLDGTSILIGWVLALLIVFVDWLIIVLPCLVLGYILMTVLTGLESRYGNIYIKWWWPWRKYICQRKK